MYTHRISLIRQKETLTFRRRWQDIMPWGTKLQGSSSNEPLKIFKLKMRQRRRKNWTFLLMCPSKHPNHDQQDNFQILAPFAHFLFLDSLASRKKGQTHNTTDVSLFFGALQWEKLSNFMFLMPRTSSLENFRPFGAKLVLQKGLKPPKNHLSALLSALVLCV